MVDKLTYFLYHMRGKGTVTQEMRASVALVQLEIGSGKNFFELPFDRWGKLATPCWVSNLWKLCSRVGITLRAAESAHWIPPLQSSSDRYIMDVVTDCVPRRDWIRINHCRRYLQVVTVADLFLHDGSRLHPDILRCKRPSGRLPNYVWPEVKPPTKACIATWKRFLGRWITAYQDRLSEDEWCELPKYSHDLTFRFNLATKVLYQYEYGKGWHQYPPIDGTRAVRGVYSKCSLVAAGLSQNYPIDTEYVEVETASDAHVIVAVSHRILAAGRYRQLQAKRASEETPVMLSERFAALPPMLKRLCGKVAVPEDGGAALARYVRETGRKLYGVSDGSAKDGTGTHGWRLCRYPGDDLALHGAGYVDGLSTTPFRAESQGQLAILIASTVLAQRWSLSMLEVLSICDNKAVLRRLAKAHRDNKLSDNKESDADLYAVYREWAKNAPVTCKYQWVKGHQDREKPMEDLLAEARINCEVDVSAGAVYERRDVPCHDPEVPVFQQEVYGVFTQSGKIVGRLKRGVLAQCGRAELEAFYEGKHQVSEGKREGINWDGLRSLLHSQPVPRRAGLVKYQQGWLPTKELLHRQGRESSAVCPLCNHASETTAHIHCCGSQEAVAWRQERLTQCLKELRTAGTAPEIVNCWGQQLSDMFGLPAPQPRLLFASKTTDQVEAAVELARKHQAVLSWQGFLQGRHSVHWIKAQTLHERIRKEGRKRGLAWSQKSVRIIRMVVPDLWSKRNELVHGATIAEESQKRRANITAKVTEVYARNPVLLPRFPSIRSVPLSTRLQAPTEVLFVWLQQVVRQEEVTLLQQRRKAMSKGAILRFLVPRTGGGSEGALDGSTVVFDPGIN